ncbi:hypothetical protein [Virgibacillus salexigens]|uniref:hypothetical protein n=1 Tax=Virgibacillus salexigens TaxID=61016 RepID=UPI003081DA1A
MKIEINSMFLDGYECKVPEGLSEILSVDRGWGVKPKVINSSYEREVKKENGELITILRKKR